MAMSRFTLQRWLFRVVAGSTGAHAVELLHKGGDDDLRTVRVYDLGDAGKERLEEIAAELLTDAQDECNIAETRSSFLIEVVTGEGDARRVLGGTRIRFEPIDEQSGRLQEHAGHEPNRDGLLALAMDQLKFAYRELGCAPAKQRQVYEDLIDAQQTIIREQREEIAKLYIMLRDRGVVDEELAAELAEAERKRAEHMSKFLGELTTFGKQLAGAVVAEHMSGAGDVADGEDTGGPLQ